MSADENKQIVLDFYQQAINDNGSVALGDGGGVRTLIR
jgi:hypothetical protein